MKDLRAITDACVLINSLENEADDIFDDAMTNLFAYCTDPIELIKEERPVPGTGNSDRQM